MYVILDVLPELSIESKIAFICLFLVCGYLLRLKIKEDKDTDKPKIDFDFINNKEHVE